MTRVVPQKESRIFNKMPNWLDPKAIAKAGTDFAKKVAGIKKEASKEKQIIASYVCTKCKKIHYAKSDELQKQAALATKANKVFEPVCPKCGSDLKPYKTIVEKAHVSNLQSLHDSVEVDIQKEASSKGMYNTYLDRRIVYEAIQKLSNYASTKGMTAPIVSYIRSEHRKEAGTDTPILNDIECKIEWMFGRKQKGWCTATLSIDPAGNFEFPKVFKVQSGMEYPFEEKYIRQLESEPRLISEMPSRKKTDTITFRPHDPSRFRTAGLDSKKKVKSEMIKVSGNLTVQAIPFSKLPNSEGIVLLGTGGDLQDWINGVTKELNKAGIVKGTPSDIWEGAYQLTTTGGRIDLALPFKESAKFNIGKLAMWRLQFGDCSWISDYKDNYASQHKKKN